MSEAEDRTAVAWAPGEAELTWRRNTMHHPRPVEPLFGDYHRSVLDRAFNDAAESIGIRTRNRCRVFNGYYYSTNYEAAGAADEPFEKSRVLASTLRLHSQWNEEWLPEIRALLAAQEAFSLEDCSDAALAAHYARTEQFTRRAWRIHYELVWPMTLAISLFADAYRELFPDDPAFAPYTLLQGIENASTATDGALWALSRAFLGEPAAVALLRRPAPTREELAETCPALAGALDRFLAAHGRRSDAFDHLTAPSWREDPRPVFDILRRFVAMTEHPLAATVARAEVARERGLARVRSEMSDFPAPVREHFEVLLRSAQTATALYEDHNHWIDQRCDHEVRRVVVEIGRRLARAGILSVAEDVYGLEVSELGDAVGALARGEAPPLWHALAAERRRVNRSYAAITMPPVIGAVPEGGPPPETDDPIDRALRLFVGMRAPAPHDPRVVRGIGGSPGTARGKVRVLRALEDVERLVGGEVLVAPTTAPSWSPVFNLVAAVVTDAGGMLSHCAIIAREYGVPCVVGCGDATSRLRDGDEVVVDGERGTVTLVVPPG